MTRCEHVVGQDDIAAEAERFDADDSVKQHDRMPRRKEALANRTLVRIMLFCRGLRLIAVGF
jgi:hypothetical protein